MLRTLVKICKVIFTLGFKVQKLRQVSGVELILGNWCMTSATLIKVTGVNPFVSNFMLLGSQGPVIAFGFLICKMGLRT